jgi:hypothetical protein
MMTKVYTSRAEAILNWEKCEDFKTSDFAYFPWVDFPVDGISFMFKIRPGAEKEKSSGSDL